MNRPEAIEWKNDCLRLLDQRKLPHNIDAEQMLLGAFLNENDYFGKVAQGLKPEDFYDPIHAQIFDTMAGLIEAGHAVSLVLNVGVAGSMDLQRAPLRSLWRVEEEIWPEYGLHDGTAVDGPSFGFPQWEGPHGPVFDRLPLAAPAQLPACLHGLCSLPAATSLSVAGVSASRQRVGQLRQAHPGALLENMEGFAVALACARQGIACVEVRSVSNRVGPRAPHETDFPGAMRRLADIWRPAP